MTWCWPSTGSSQPESITIAFPQVVVWSGEQHPDRLYGGEVGEVRAPYPGLDQPESAQERRGPQWRLPGRRIADRRSSS